MMLQNGYHKSLHSPKLLRNFYLGKNVAGEAFVSDHIFSYIMSGTHEVWVGDRKYFFGKGDYRFFKRNQLTRFVKSTQSDGFRSIAIHIDQYTLKEMASEHGLKVYGHYQGEGVKLVDANGMLKSFVNSLNIYADNDRLDHDILTLKTKELVLILAELNPVLKHMLFEFSDPGKLDLEAFMNGHYRYNVPLERFAFLTGRSLSGFKRDFARLFNMTPGRWLVKKRLTEAKYLIEQRFARPTEIYMELGFMDLSHFSYAYKKAFGKAPSKRI